MTRVIYTSCAAALRSGEGGRSSDPRKVLPTRRQQGYILIYGDNRTRRWERRKLEGSLPLENSWQARVHQIPSLPKEQGYPTPYTLVALTLTAHSPSLHVFLNPSFHLGNKTCLWYPVSRPGGHLMKANPLYATVRTPFHLRGRRGCARSRLPRPATIGGATDGNPGFRGVSPTPPLLLRHQVLET